MLWNNIVHIFSSHYAPEAFIAVLAIMVLMAGLFKGADVFKKLAVYSGVLLLLSLFLFMNPFDHEYERHLSYNSFTTIIRMLIVILTAAVLFILSGANTNRDYYKPELISLVLLSLFGAMNMLLAANFLVLYISVELQALSLYVLAASNRDNGASSEAGLKYFILSAIASGIMLYGISLIYAFTGTISFDSLKAVLNNDFINIGTLPIAIVIGMVMLVIGFFFNFIKIHYLYDIEIVVSGNN